MSDFRKHVKDLFESTLHEIEDEPMVAPEEEVGGEVIPGEEVVETITMDKTLLVKLLDYAYDQGAGLGSDEELDVEGDDTDVFDEPAEVVPGEGDEELDETAVGGMAMGGGTATPAIANVKAPVGKPERRLSEEDDELEVEDDLEDDVEAELDLEGGEGEGEEDLLGGGFDADNIADLAVDLLSQSEDGALHDEDFTGLTGEADPEADGLGDLEGGEEAPFTDEPEAEPVVDEPEL